MARPEHGSASPRLDERAEVEPALLTIGGGAVYVAVAVGWVRPRLAWLKRGLDAGRPLSDDRVTLVLLVLIVCALISDRIGIYAIMVLMAVVTTLIASPLYSLLAGRGTST